MKRDFSQEKIEELWSEATESCSVYLKSLANITDLEELGLPEVVVNIKISERYVEQLEEKEVLTINKLAEIITNVKEVDKTYAGYLKTLNEQLEAYGRKVQALTEMLQPEKLSVSNGSYMRELLAIGREYQEAANNSELIKVEIWLRPGHKMSEEEIAEAQEILDRYFAKGTEAEKRFFANPYHPIDQRVYEYWTERDWRRYQLMCALYEKVDSKSSFSSGLAEEIQFMGKFRNWSLDISAWYYGYEVNDFQKSNNVFANSHTQHPYITFGGNLTGGLLTYNMASSVAGHIPGLAQRIGGWSERLSTFPILRRIGQDHLSNIIGATIVDTGAFTVPKAIIDIYNGESSETVFQNAGVDIGRNVLFNIFGEAVSGAVGRVVQRFKGGSNTIKWGTSTLAKYGDDFGKMGTYIENPNIKVDWTQYAEHAAERMQQRGMTQEMINNIVENGKVLSQNNGNKFAYITQEGVAIVSKEGKLITAWSSTDFDSSMLEVISKLFGE